MALPAALHIQIQLFLRAAFVCFNDIIQVVMGSLAALYYLKGIQSLFCHCNELQEARTCQAKVVQKDKFPVGEEEIPNVHNRSEVSLFCALSLHRKSSLDLKTTEHFFQVPCWLNRVSGGAGARQQVWALFFCFCFCFWVKLVENLVV